MRTIRPSDWLFGALLLPFLVFAVIILFGLTSASFWTGLLPTIGVILAVSAMRGSASTWRRSTRLALWSCIGLAFVATLAAVRGQTLTAAAAAASVLVFAIVGLLAERQDRSRRGLA